MQLDTTLIQIGENLICSLSVDDGFDQVSQDTVVSITEEPVASFTSEAVISYPNGKQVGDTVTCSATAVDGLGILQVYLIVGLMPWVLKFKSGNSLYLTPSNTEPLENITCTFHCSRFINRYFYRYHTNNNTPPTMSVVSVNPISGIYRDGTVYCSAQGYDDDQKTLSYEYKWEDVSGNVIYTGGQMPVSQTPLDVGDQLLSGLLLRIVPQILWKDFL